MKLAIQENTIINMPTLLIKREIIYMIKTIIIHLSCTYKKDMPFIVKKKKLYKEIKVLNHMLRGTLNIYQILHNLWLMKVLMRLKLLKNTFFTG